MPAAAAGKAVGRGGGWVGAPHGPPNIRYKE